MNPTLKLWFHGLFAAFIGGGSSAIVSILATPNFGTQADWVKAAQIFFVSGAITAFAYLKQSPLPPDFGPGVSPTDSKPPTPPTK
jgi:hypothetical protein